MTKTTKSTSTPSSTRPTNKSKESKPRVCKIHVSQPAIRANLKKQRYGEEGYAPVITVKRGSENVYGHEVIIYDKEGNVVARVIQPRDETLNCGARVWIETNAVVEVREHKEDHDLVTELLR
jgi:hypothetical protein